MRSPPRASAPLKARYVIPIRRHLHDDGGRGDPLHPDSSEPTATSGTVYSAPIAVSATTTVRAIAFKKGMNDSSVASATFTIAAAPDTKEPSASNRSPMTRWPRLRTPSSAPRKSMPTITTRRTSIRPAACWIPRLRREPATRPLPGPAQRIQGQSGPLVRQFSARWRPRTSPPAWTLCGRSSSISRLTNSWPMISRRPPRVSMRQKASTTGKTTRARGPRPGRRCERWPT